MKKLAIIFDLDNTIYGVHTIGYKLFPPLLKVIEEDGSHHEHIEEIKQEIMRAPFQRVAEQFNFSEELKERGTEVLKQLSYDGEMQPFEDYQVAKRFPQRKFLVTTGFKKMQQSKVKNMNLERDFEEIHIVDPSTTNKTKKDIFAEIIERNGFAKADVLVIGDDMDSEIKAAMELGVDAVLYDKLERYENETRVPRIKHYTELGRFIGE
jgi:putative hydrolase of the HAD superfamily